MSPSCNWTRPSCNKGGYILYTECTQVHYSKTVYIYSQCYSIPRVWNIIPYPSTPTRTTAARSTRRAPRVSVGSGFSSTTCGSPHHWFAPPRAVHHITFFFSTPCGALHLDFFILMSCTLLF
jgi:hypothetical protein